MPGNGLGLHGEGFGSAQLYCELWGGVGGCNYTHYWHMASVAMAQFTIVPRSLATQVKTFANTAKLYDLT